MASNTTNTSSPVNDWRLSDDGYTAVGTYLTIMGTVSFILNAFVILVMVKGHPKFRGIHNMLLLNLAISDLLMCVVAYPITASASFAKQWIYSDSICTFVGFWVFLCAENDMNTLAVISISRYIIVCKPQYEYYLKRKRSKYCVLACIWGYALLNVSPPLFGWSSFEQEAFGTSCSIDWISNTPAVISYNITVTITCYAVHLIIFAFCYTNIIKSFSSQSKQSEPVKTDGKDEKVLKMEYLAWQHKIQTSRNVAATSMALVVTFVMAWTPYAIISMYIMSAKKASAWVIVLPTMFAKSCTMFNPIVCALISSKFREAAYLLFCKLNKVQPDQNSVKMLPRQSGISEPVTYKGDMTKDDIYIGNVTITLPVDDQIV